MPTSSVSTFCYCCKHFEIPKMCTFTWCTYDIVQKLALWWLYEPKHVVTLVIDNNISCVLTELTLECIWMGHIRDEIDQMVKESIQELLRKVQTLWRIKESLTIFWREGSVKVLSAGWYFQWMIILVNTVFMKCGVSYCEGNINIKLFRPKKCTTIPNWEWKIMCTIWDSK